MAYVSKIKDSSNNINYIKYGIYPVVGTQTQSTSSWTGSIDVPSLYNGLTIAYFLPYTASSTVDVTLNLTLSDEQTTTGAIDVYYSDDSRLNSQYDEGSTILLTYWGSGMEVGGVATTVARWVRSDSGEFARHPDWEQDDSTDLAYIENKPAIKAGEGENSIVEGDISVSSGSGIAKLSITGEANATEFSYTVVDNGGLNVSLVDCVCYIADASPATRKYQVIEELDALNHKITFSASLSSSALTNSEVIVYRKYKKALGKSSHVEGNQTLAANNYSHAEGNNCAAVGNYSHAENNNTIAKSLGSHAEGSYTRAYSSYSHVEGLGTIAASEYQHVQGQYNIEDANGTYADIVGNGSSSTRSNAYTLDWNGNGVYAGKVTVGTAPTNDMDVATKKYVDDNADNNTTYGISMSSNIITLTGSDGNSSTIALPVYSGSMSTVGGGA